MANTIIPFAPGTSGLDVRYWLYSNGKVFRPAVPGLVTAASITISQYKAALVAITEEVSSDSSKTGNYPLDLSAITGLPSNIPYTVYYVTGAAPNLANLIGVADGFWDGTQIRMLGGPMTEAYAALHSTQVTMEQALYEIMSLIEEYSIASTTLTHNKRDGATAAGTTTLNSATAPTSRTRAT